MNICIVVYGSIGKRHHNILSKIFNNTVHYKTAGGVTGSDKYLLRAEGTDEGKNTGVGSIDTI